MTVKIDAQQKQSTPQIRMISQNLLCQPGRFNHKSVKSHDNKCGRLSYIVIRTILYIFAKLQPGSFSGSEWIILIKSLENACNNVVIFLNMIWCKYDLGVYFQH